MTHRTHVRTGVFITIAIVNVIAIAGCKPQTMTAANTAPRGTADPSAPASPRIDIPPSVRQNLGITFVTVERRPVHSTKRLPGQFEFRPEARREYHVVLPGRIELLVKQYDRVKAGQALFYLESPEWQKMQNELVSAGNAMKRSHADVAVAEATVHETEKTVAFQEDRLASLAEAQVRQVVLEAELADRRNTLPRLRAELDAARAEFDAAHARYEVMLSTAASLARIPIEALDPSIDQHGHLGTGEPPWRSLNRLTVRAEAAGIVDRLAVTNLGWAETGELVLDTIDPSALRFHGDALQTDIVLFADGQPARVVPPLGGSIALQETGEGTIELGFQADSQQRTIPIFLVPDRFPRWAKAGVTAYLEVYVDGKGGAVLAIPESAIVRDGLEKIFFLRDRNDSNKAIRVVADLGASDGRWVEVKSGVMVGDEIVWGGVYPLMLASSTSGEIQQGGHFHSDGTFHKGEDQ